MVSTPETAPDSPDSAPQHGPSSAVRKTGAGVLALGALGIVYGDIGTSPLYALKQTFTETRGLTPDPGSVYGVLSLVFWTITIIVSVKYVSLVTRADNDGEGGTMALISLIQQVKRLAARTRWLLIGLGVLGAALFFGDGMITPAISVLGAVEGLEVASPGLKMWVVPIAIVLLTALFYCQRFGTGAVGKAFGPVMLLWFVVMGVLGLVHVIAQPGILRALSPTYAVAFFFHDFPTAFLSLGSVVLAITGSEALYADIGHFGRRPIRNAWFAVVFPALILNYLGQGAIVLSDPRAADNPFFRLAPSWGQYPLLILATAAAVIASQSVVTGTFSMARQAVQLGYLPFLTIRHTSEKEVGQVYVPAVNWVLFVAVIGLVIGFGSSTALASAYGIAVTGTLTITTVLFFVVARRRWGTPMWLVVIGAGGLLIVELAFLAANLTKVLSGGWFPLIIGITVAVILMTWHRGREIVTRKRTEQEGPLEDFVRGVATSDDPPIRVPGTAVFLNANAGTTPLALRHNVRYNHVLHEHVLVLNVQNVTVPHVPRSQRLEIDDACVPDDGIFHLTVRFGYQDKPYVPAALRLARQKGLDLDFKHATYFLSRITITHTREPGLARWRKRLFCVMSRNAVSPAAYFGLPPHQVVSLGSPIDV
ncbi:potassium transporter Kup [Pseudonocardia xinjiangensis]|uniref:potassium transporter Kup n=1 Tax=Pseudonocardia xinjiangensis TaxID=75289 RepID=UPI003D91B86C